MKYTQLPSEYDVIGAAIVEAAFKVRSFRSLRHHFYGLVTKNASHRFSRIALKSYFKFDALLFRGNPHQSGVAENRRLGWHHKICRCPTALLRYLRNLWLSILLRSGEARKIGSDFRRRIISRLA